MLLNFQVKKKFFLVEDDIRFLLSCNKLPQI